MPRAADRTSAGAGARRLIRLLLLALLALLALPAFVLFATPLRAQQGDSIVVDTIFLRAQRMVAEGQGDSGRALVQAQLDSAATGSPRFVEALYFRAVVAATAADAERDLRRIIVEYPLSPWSGNALMRLAQLEMARGDDAQALAHLARVVEEHPDSPDRAQADFWMARIHFERGNTAAACARLADGERTTPPSRVELRNQLDYLNQRCAGVDTTAAAQTAAAGAGAAAGGAAKPAAPPAGRPSPAPTGAAPKAAPRSVPTAAPRRAAAREPVRFTVQVAAFSTRDAAEHLRATLAARGLEARVVGTARPYRVRVGRYATRAEAEREAKRLGGFVTEAEAR